VDCRVPIVNPVACTDQGVSGWNHRLTMVQIHTPEKRHDFKA